SVTGTNHRATSARWTAISGMRARPTRVVRYHLGRTRTGPGVTQSIGVSSWVSWRSQTGFGQSSGHSGPTYSCYEKTSAGLRNPALAVRRIGELTRPVRANECG